MKKIILTGQSGLNKKEFLENAKKTFLDLGLKFHYESLGERIIKRFGQSFNEKNILNLPRYVLDLSRSCVNDLILEEINNSDYDIFLLNTHAVFRWQHGLFPSLDLDFVQKFKPDIIICLIDDIADIKNGLIKRGTDIFLLWELFAWREEEVWVSKFIAEYLSKILGKNIHFYLYPKKEGPDMFAKLITQNDIPKSYLSFPITGISDQEKREIDEFKLTLKKKIISFDPYSIKDRQLITIYNTIEEEIQEELKQLFIQIENSNIPSTQNNVWSLYIDELSPLLLTKIQYNEIEFLGRDFSNIINTIDYQIISRDYLLIDQCDFIVMYIVKENDAPRISAGCQSELVYAYNKGKEVYVIYSGGEKELSPWVTQYSQVFRDINNCLDFLTRKYLNKIQS
ncbi:MAG: AAA family ATPase [Promethearchaeota archaeon]